MQKVNFAYVLRYIYLYASIANIQEVMKFYNLDDKTLKQTLI